MKTKNSILLLTSMATMSQTVAHAAGPTGMGFRPAFTKSVEAEKTDFNAQVADMQIAARMIKAISESKIYRLEQTTLDRLGEGYAKNRTLQEMVKSINSQMSFAQQDTMIREINELRLTIASYLKDVDPMDSQGQQNEITASQNDLATLVMGLSPLNLSVKAKENIKYFLSTLKTSISDGAQLKDALRVANESMAIDKGIEIDLSLIQASARSGGGVAELFKTSEDLQELIVNGPGGAPLTVRMSLKKAKEVEQMAHEKALTLLEMAKNPDVAGAFKNKAMKDLKGSMDSVNTFMKDNPLLDRQSGKYKAINDTKVEVAKSVDELMGQLQELGAAVGGRGVQHKLARFARSTIPFADRLIKDPVAWKRSIREKIIEIDKVLVDGVNRLDSNNQALSHLKAQALEKMSDLQIQMAETKLVADFVQHYKEQLEQQGNKETAHLIASEIIPRIQRELNGAMSLYGVLTASVEAMNDIVRTNNMIITNSIQLRTVAAPAIAITESVKEAGRDADKIIRQSQVISKFVENQMVEMSAQIKKNNEKFAQHAGESIVSPEVLEKVLTDLANEREAMSKRMAIAGEKLRASNEKLVSVLNRANQTLKQDSIGVQVDGMVHGNPQSRH